MGGLNKTLGVLFSNSREFLPDAVVDVAEDAARAVVDKVHIVERTLKRRDERISADLYNAPLEIDRAWANKQYLQAAVLTVWPVSKEAQVVLDNHPLVRQSSNPSREQFDALRSTVVASLGMYASAAIEGVSGKSDPELQHAMVMAGGWAGDTLNSIGEFALAAQMPLGTATPHDATMVEFFQQAGQGNRGAGSSKVVPQPAAARPFAPVSPRTAPSSQSVPIVEENAVQTASGFQGVLPLGRSAHNFMQSPQQRMPMHLNIENRDVHEPSLNVEPRVPETATRSRAARTLSWGAQALSQLAQRQRGLRSQIGQVADGLKLFAMPLARPLNTQTIKARVAPIQTLGAALQDRYRLGSSRSTELIGALTKFDRALPTVSTLTGSLTNGWAAMRSLKGAPKPSDQAANFVPANSQLLEHNAVFNGNDDIKFLPQTMLVNGRVIESAKPVNPGITILTPTRGSPEKLQGMLDNVKEQTYSGPIKHVIMIDDCPKTRAFLEENYKDNPHVTWRYYQREEPLLPMSCRLSRLRNIAIHNVDTEIVVSMDTDVRFTPDHLNNLAKAMRESEADLVYADRILCDEQLRPIKEKIVPWVIKGETEHEAYERKVKEGRVSFDPETEQIVLIDNLDNGFMDTNSYMTRTKIYRQYPIPVSGDIGTEDIWHARVLSEASKGGEISAFKIDGASVFYPVGGYTNKNGACAVGYTNITD